MKPNAVDAFCGAGGLSLGLKDAGFDILAGFDVDPACLTTLQRNSALIRHRVFEADVCSLKNGKLLKLLNLKPGELDLLAGGPPCQGFSVQRTIGGDEDSRNDLIGHYGDLILELEPKFFLMENVPGIGGKRGRARLSEFIRRMRNNEYFVHEILLDAQDFGVPQRRRRYIAVGERIGKGQAPVFRWPARRRQSQLTVRSAIGDLPAPNADGSEHPAFANHRADKLSNLNLRRIAALRPGEGRIHLPTELLADCHKISAEVTGHRNVYGRMDWDDVAPTITARFDSFTRGKFGHPSQNRSISLREGARLQSFPDKYVFVGSKVEVARQIGNAVPPAFGRALGLAICKSLRRKANA